MRTMRTLAALGFAASLVSVTANAATDGEGAYISLFAGSWSGSGMVLKSSIPVQVSCRATGQPGDNHITIEGNCSVAILSVRIAADITYDPTTDSYSGTYVGAKVGPAHVFGKRDGNVVNLAITWPKPVHGDTKARMTIENAGNGSLRITISDNVAPGGPEERTSDVKLSQI